MEHDKKLMKLHTHHCGVFSNRFRGDGGNWNKKQKTIDKYELKVTYKNGALMRLIKEKKYIFHCLLSAVKEKTRWLIDWMEMHDEIFGSIMETKI